jgi:hypothetical protein
MKGREGKGRGNTEAAPQRRIKITTMEVVNLSYETKYGEA